MADITVGGNPVKTIGTLPSKGSNAPAFTLVNGDLEDKSLSDYKGSRVILNIFPSLDTGTCAASVRRFNSEAGKLENTKVLCISADLPFASSRFCSAEGLENVVTLSVFRSPEFGKDYGVQFITGPIKGLMSRSVVVINEEGLVIYTQQVPETSNEPDYEPVLASLK